MPSFSLLSHSNRDRILKPRSPIHVAAFNVRTLLQIGQQASLAQTLDSLCIDVCCVSETRIQDPSSVMHLKPPGKNPVCSTYTLRVSGDPTASARGLAGVGIALSSRAESSLLDWIPVNSRLCAVRLNGSVRVNKQRNRWRCLFIVSVYAPTDCSADDLKDAFYRDLHNLLQKARQSDVVVICGDFNAQVGRLGPSEKHLGGPYGIHSARTDNGDRLLQLCADRRLYLASTNFNHKRRNCVTWRPPSSSQQWSQIDHIVISYRWRGCIEDCRSFWSTPLDSDHALVRARISLRFNCKRNPHIKTLPSYQLRDRNIKVAYQTELACKLSQVDEITEPSEGWKCLMSAMKSAFEAVSQETPQTVHKEWISSRSVALIDLRKTIPSDQGYDKERKSLKRRLTKSLRMDREQWWIAKAEEMEKAASMGNNRLLFQLIRNTGSKKPSVSETINEKDGSLITSQERRLQRWAEHFEEQFNWSKNSVELIHGPPEAEWEVELGPPTFDEVDQALRALKRDKSAGPDGLPPALFKDGGDSLKIALTELLASVWKSESVPVEWCSSIIIPVFKKGSRTSCENHRGISLVSIASKLLTMIILRRLTGAREKQIRENQAGFRPGRGCIDHIFTLRQILEHRHSFNRSTIVVFLDLKAAFDSVDRGTLWHCLSLKRVT